MTDREAYIALNMIEGLGPVTVRALIDALGSPSAGKVGKVGKVSVLLFSCF
jgi:hypothetical protein